MAVARRYRAPSALLPGGWAKDVVIEVDADGAIAAVEPGGQGGEPLAGPVLPGFPNLHSHAFQRAMAGRAERSGPGEDSFWTWRAVMYHFVERLTPEDVRAIAAQLQVELLEAGYTALGEFHYLHHDPEGRPYADRAAMGCAVMEAARETGIALTMLPVLYSHSDFGGRPPVEGQRRFLNDIDGLMAIHDALAADAGREATLGLAAHSLRAVTLDQLHALAAAAGPETPLHIHVAEQMREVDSALSWSGRRPVRLLADTVALDRRWCLVHATHIDQAEVKTIAESGATIALCPTTEANLGDGLFPFTAYAAAGGRWGVGSDSHVATSPFEELRMLEYGQRLSLRQRNLARTPASPSTGRALVEGALAGAQALGRACGQLAPGARADLIVLRKADDPILFDREADDLLDALTFAASRPPTLDVMIGGEWQVESGRHRRRDTIAAEWRRTIERLTG